MDMTDANRKDMKRDLERERRFLKEAHGLSDDEIEELKQEYEDLEELLDEVVEYGDRAETLLDDTDKGSDESSTVAESAELSSDQRERLEAWDLDVVTVDGREVVEAHQIDKRLRRLERQIAEAQEQADRINENLDARKEVKSEFDIDVEAERRNIEEQRQQINDAKERIGLSTSSNQPSDQDES